MLANRIIQAAAAASQANSKVYVDDVFSAYTYTGNGATQTITNGIQLGTWSPWSDGGSLPTSSQRGYVDVTYTNDRFVAVCARTGGGSFPSTNFAYSLDGMSWSGGTLPSSIWSTVCYGNGKLVVFSRYYEAGGNNSVCYYSSDNGGNWTQATGLPTTSDFFSATYVNGEFWVSDAASNNSYKSSDGVSWSTIYTGLNTAISRVIYANSVYFLYSPSQYSSSATGGTGTWSAASANGMTINSVAFGAGLFIAAASNGIHTSTNGSSWTLRQSTNNSSKIHYNGVYFVCTGDVTYVSLDGITWVARPSFTQALIASGGGKTVLVRSGADIYASAYATSDAPISQGKGGMVWIKDRTNGSGNHYLSDTLRPGGSANALSLVTNSTAAASTGGFVDYTSYTSAGFTANFVSGGGGITTSSSSYISWTFRKAAKFFDVVTYTGNSANGRSIAHNLGVTPGMIIIKCTSAGTTSWIVWHRSLATPTVDWLVLNSSAAADSTNAFWSNTAPTSTHFTVSSNSNVNASPETYVAYIFAHDTATDGIIQCGSSTNGATVTLGWEPQFLLIKRTDSSTLGQWTLVDTMRDWSYGSVTAPHLEANTASAESNGIVLGKPLATGFTVSMGAAGTYIYVAIRRPNKPPTLGTQVYKAIARTGTGAVVTVTGVGFPTDLVITGTTTTANGVKLFDRLRGATKMIYHYATAAEQTLSDSLTGFDHMDGYKLGADTGGIIINQTTPYINWSFKRAPGVFDIVCYTGTGSGSPSAAHSLGVVPSFIIYKRRDAADDWFVVAQASNGDYLLKLNSNAISAFGPQTYPYARDASIFYPREMDGGFGPCNVASATYVAYLFATKSGISKVGSYTGDGSTGKIINCDFTTTARFILIKRTDAAGDWYIWDTTRGITNGSNDPHLSLNTTAAEVTTDNSIDPHSQGFMVNQVAATNINVNTATYIYLAIS